MNLKNKKAKNSLKNLISSPLLFILMGIFLLPKTAYLSTITPDNIIKLTNQERQELNLSNLTENTALNHAAEAKAKDLFKNQVFEHNIKERKFSQWIKDAGYEYSYVGENLAIDFVTSEGVIKAWLDSPTHRQNLLNERFSEIGIAVMENKFQNENTIIVVQIFGSPLVEKNAELTLTETPDNLKTTLSTENFLDNSQSKTTTSAKTVYLKNNTKTLNFPIALVTLFSTSMSFAFYQANLNNKKIKQ